MCMATDVCAVYLKINIEGMLLSRVAVSESITTNKRMKRMTKQKHERIREVTSRGERCQSWRCIFSATILENITEKEKNNVHDLFL